MAWSFDLRTAITFGALVTLLTGVLLLLSWKSLSSAVRPSLRWWLAGMLLYPLGLLLVSMRDPATNWLSIPLANTLLAMALTCMAIAMRSFYGLPERRARLYGLTALVGLVAVYFADVIPSLQWRIITVSTLLAVLMGSSARAVFRRSGPPGAVPQLTGALFAFATLAMLARAAHEALWPIAEADVMKASPINLICLGVLALLPVLATVGFLLMSTERSQEELERTAQLDYLTGIFNRRAIEDLAARAISASRRHGFALAIMIVDVDYFKRINDEHGHEAGDQALVETVRRMRDVMRAEDLVGRQGGEEFVVVMPDIDLGSAHAAAERLRRSFADRPMIINSGARPIAVSVTVSVGVAALEPADLLFSHLLRRADRAMYAAKAAGRNKVMLDMGGL